MSKFSTALVDSVYHMTDVWSKKIIDNPSIKDDPELKAAAANVGEAIDNFYMLIGNKNEN